MTRALLLGAAFAIALASLPASLLADGAKTATEIRVRVVPEQTIRFVQDIDWETKQKAGKKRYRGYGTTHHEIALAISAVDTDGNATARISIDRSWGELDTVQTGKVTFDSADTSTAIERSVYGNRAGTAWDVTLRTDGTFAEIEALLALQAKGTGPGTARDDRTELGEQWNEMEGLRQLALLLPRLPDRKMPAGTFYEDFAPCGTQGRWSFRLARRSELARKNDDQFVVKASGKMRDLDAPPGRKKKNKSKQGNTLKKATFTGAYVLSRADGLPRTSEVEMVIQSAVTFSEGKGTSTETVKLALRRVAE